jgi:hypothetical protein
MRARANRPRGLTITTSLRGLVPYFTLPFVRLRSKGVGVVFDTYVNTDPGHVHKDVSCAVEGCV